MKHKDLINPELHSRLTQVLKWRNMIHLMGLEDLDRKYFGDSDLNYTFDVSKDLKDLVSKDLAD